MRTQSHLTKVNSSVGFLELVIRLVVGRSATRVLVGGWCATGSGNARELFFRHWPRQLSHHWYCLFFCLFVFHVSRLCFLLCLHDGSGSCFPPWTRRYIRRSYKI